MTVEEHLIDLLATMCEGWRLGDGKLFAMPFASDAHFVAFDGSAHHGQGEIAAFHQRAFDGVLKGSSLSLAVGEVKQIDQKTWLVFATGWHIPNGASADRHGNESVQIFVCRVDEASAEVLAFQNTRSRPITDKASAERWRAFDASWEGRTD